MDSDRINKVRSLLKKQFQQRYLNKRGSSQSTTRENLKQPLDALSHNINLSLNMSNQKHQRRNRSIQLQSKLSQTLQNISFDHHQKEQCLCDNCSCGRHFCKFNTIKPDLTKRTHYQNVYVKKNRAEQTPVLIAKEVNPLKGNHLDLQTIYTKEYRERIMDKLERPKPADELNLFGGPIQSITTYKNLYPGHTGDNQYIKPTDKHRIGNFPIFAETSYNSQFVHKKISKSKYDKIPDHLKQGTTWMGSTTYYNTFTNPNPQDYPKKVVMKMEKYQKQPDNLSKYITHNKKEFIEKQSTICPSKIHLLNKSRYPSNDNKNVCRENYDFRTMSPQFHPFSTSKSYYD